MSRGVFAIFLMLTGGALYLTWYGVGAESSSLVKSVRAGSIGNTSGFIGK